MEQAVTATLVRPCRAPEESLAPVPYAAPSERVRQLTENYHGQKFKHLQECYFRELGS